MSEFAFSAIGINPHHGTPVNAATLALDPTPRAPGGSTSGGATSVASGAAWAALGSDTGGSIRIPAALQGLVGFKATARRVPISGAVPLSTTLDTVSAITLSVRDAVALHEVLADRRVTIATRPLRGRRFAVPRRVVLDALDATAARAFTRSLGALSRAGAQIDEVDLGALDEVASINAAGGFPAAESWAYHRRWLATREAEYDPRVARRIRRGEAMSAADYIDLLVPGAAWIARIEAALEGVDALLSPTVPIVAPPLEPLVADDDAFFATNGAAAAQPERRQLPRWLRAQPALPRAGELPVGLMVWHGGGHDDHVLGAGARGRSRAPGADIGAQAEMQVAVIGAGVIGVTTAYELAVDGHEVTVFERAGTVAAGAASPTPAWSRPAMSHPGRRPACRRKVGATVRRARTGPHRRPPRHRALGWTWRWWRRAGRRLPRESRTHAPARPVQPRAAAAAHAGLQLDFERAQGFLVLLRSARELALAEVA